MIVQFHSDDEALPAHRLASGVKNGFIINCEPQLRVEICIKSTWPLALPKMEVVEKMKEQ